MFVFSKGFQNWQHNYFLTSHKSTGTCISCKRYLLGYDYIHEPAIYNHCSYPMQDLRLSSYWIYAYSNWQKTAVKFPDVFMEKIGTKSLFCIWNEVYRNTFLLIYMIYLRTLFIFLMYSLKSQNNWLALKVKCFVIIFVL